MFFFSKVFKTKDNAVIAQCQLSCGFWPFPVLYEYMRINFLSFLLGKGCINRTDSFSCADFDELVALTNKYSLNLNDTKSVIKDKLWACMC